MPNPANRSLRGQCASRHFEGFHRKYISAFAGKDPFERCVGQRRKKQVSVPVLLAQGITDLAARSQDYLSYKLTGPVLLAQGITGLAALGHSQSYLSCKLTSWSCLLKGLLVLQLAHRITYLATHRLGLACSRDYWSCSPRLLTELPVLQTHGVVLLLKGLLVLQLSARSQGYLSCKLTAWQLVRPLLNGNPKKFKAP